MTTAKPTHHGGKRNGAGRKPKPQGEKFVRVLVTLPPVEAEWLRKHYPHHASTVIAELIGLLIEVRESRS